MRQTTISTPCILFQALHALSAFLNTLKHKRISTFLNPHTKNATRFLNTPQTCP
ncbi:hypothetical protein BN341_18950 [Helicobacter heilmannii ASB1.4]|uniref:Uncharacterized protein n=1 Tax=Helicobacter heilmannii TaxID=35817 RepID=A0A0K2Y7T4_HELHE|nr:hypothetical protein BN341_18950 [Helicobacter heilmannii ASB1.4]CRI33739.1 hypothetical protein HHE01_14250 [Helicobacter heilmannii]